MVKGTNSFRLEPEILNNSSALLPQFLLSPLKRFPPFEIITERHKAVEQSTRYDVRKGPQPAALVDVT